MLEAARLHRLLRGVPIVATGGVELAAAFRIRCSWRSNSSGRRTGGPRSSGKRSRPTRAIMRCFVPPLLKQHGFDRFVLVTSQQHIARALCCLSRRRLSTRCRRRPKCMSHEAPRSIGVVPSRAGLSVSELVFYDLMGQGVLPERAGGY